ncbi:hypothetical protein [Flavobacterium sp.]|uniref:hypothetical protein n=1 Tax=Flavobacterium sp. TaxID=239 RepID=UPI0025C66955|nr:hypothetical protein [Flavobacterium sp.]
MIESSFIVALSAFALIQVTCIRLGLPMDVSVSGFGFFGTIVGYNFVKYDALARSGKPTLGRKLKAVIALSFASFLATAYFFFHLNILTQIVSIFVFGITALYTLPFFPNKKNARDWAGLKIYFVAISWVGVTVILPVLNLGAQMDFDFYAMCVQRFILIVVLLFIFEIIDLAWDDPHLRTVPQQIGVERTKWLGFALMIVWFVLELPKSHHIPLVSSCNIGFGVVIVAFLFFANQGRGKYYTTFWVEILPVFWWLAFLFFAEIR